MSFNYQLKNERQYKRNHHAAAIAVRDGPIVTIAHVVNARSLFELGGVLMIAVTIWFGVIVIS
jgi:hypothetical protein